MNAKANVKATETNATYLNVRSSGCSVAHLVTVSDGYVDVTILRLGGKGIELKVMLKPAMPDASWDYLRQVTQVLGMKNIGAVYFALKLKPVRKLALSRQGFGQRNSNRMLRKRWEISDHSQ
jgi:hypothetical protein